MSWRQILSAAIQRSFIRTEASGIQLWQPGSHIVWVGAARRDFKLALRLNQFVTLANLNPVLLFDRSLPLQPTQSPADID
jgi:hypothetical protein